jgi:hypothetical protein
MNDTSQKYMLIPLVSKLLESYTNQEHEAWEWFLIDSLYNHILKHGRSFKAYDLEELIKRWMKCTPDLYKGLQLAFLEGFAKICKAAYQDLSPADRVVCYENGNPANVAGVWKVAGYRVPTDLIANFASICSEESKWQILQSRWNRDFGLFVRFKQHIIQGRYNDHRHICHQHTYVIACRCKKCGAPMSYQKLSQHRGTKTMLCRKCRSVGFGR